MPESDPPAGPLPALFLSHGSPMLALSRGPAQQFFASLKVRFGAPRAIVVASAHWETERPMVTAAPALGTIHDFGGFPAPLYALRYPAPGDPALAVQICALLTAAGFAAGQDTRRGRDHGAWIPLLLAWPEAEIPVLQLSVQGHLGPAHHFALGRALAPLRALGVLLVGSGSFTHDLSRYRGQAEDAGEAPDVAAFAAWMDQALNEGRIAELLAYRRLAPFAEREHPTEEHLLPLFFALGAGGKAARARRLHQSTSYGVLRMDAYAFA